jgi:hypothetical protein
MKFQDLGFRGLRVEGLGNFRTLDLGGLEDPQDRLFQGSENLVFGKLRLITCAVFLPRRCGSTGR